MRVLRTVYYNHIGSMIKVPQLKPADAACDVCRILIVLYTCDHSYLAAKTLLNVSYQCMCISSCAL